MMREQCLEPPGKIHYSTCSQTGALSGVSNWRAITVLKSKVGVDHAFADFDTVTSKCVESNMVVWITSPHLKFEIARPLVWDSTGPAAARPFKEAICHLLGPTWCKNRRRIKLSPVVYGLHVATQARCVHHFFVMDVQPENAPKMIIEQLPPDRFCASEQRKEHQGWAKKATQGNGGAGEERLCLATMRIAPHTHTSTHTQDCGPGHSLLHSCFHALPADQLLQPILAV